MICLSMFYYFLFEEPHKINSVLRMINYSSSVYFVEIVFSDKMIKIKLRNFKQDIIRQFQHRRYF